MPITFDPVKRYYSQSVCPRCQRQGCLKCTLEHGRIVIYCQQTMKEVKPELLSSKA